MRYLVLSRFLLAISLLSVFVPSCKARVVEGNVARGKSYTFAPAPNYSLCTDKGDATQLTDGMSYGSWWVKKSTVGWRWGSTGIEIIIDLEKSNIIDKVKIYSVGGGLAGVEFPEFIALLVSNDGRDYSFVNLIDDEEVAEVRSVGRNRVPHTFVLDELNVEARFVKLVVRPSTAFFFLDEIEVLGQRKDSFLRAGIRNDMVVFKDSKVLRDGIDGYFELNKTFEETNKFLRKNRYKLSSELFNNSSSELESLAVKCQVPTKKIYLPDELLEVQRELGVLRGGIYKGIHGKDFFCFVANPMDKLLAREMIEVGPNGKKDLEINLWQNEYESSAINILNCSDKPIDLRVSLSPTISEDGTRIDSKNVYSVRRAIFVNVLGAGLLADPLVLQTDEPFKVEPGATAQIWLTVFGEKLRKGLYHSVFAISGSMGGKDLPIQTININMNVESITFPNQASLNTCVWDEYTSSSQITRNDLTATSRDLKSHHINVGVVHPNLVPLLKMPYKDRDRFEKYLANRDSYRMHLIFFGWWPKNSGSHGGRDGGRFGEWMSASWKRNFSIWLQELVKILREKGIGYDRFAVYPFDESLCDEFYQVAKLVKEIDPRIKIYANDFGRGPKDFKRFKNLIDIWAPHWKHCNAHPDWLEDIKSFGKEVWTYRTKGPGRANDPCFYYRLMSWDAYARGQTGAGFWIYTTYHKQYWNDSDDPSGRGYYDAIYGQAGSPVDTNGEKIIPSRRWEAWREGVEDYEYLVQLKEIIKQVRKRDKNAADQAESVLASQVKRVVTNREDADLVYEARELINKMILELKEKTGK